MILYNMQKNQILSGLDTRLKNYVEQNNSLYKRNIQSVFMNKEQLVTFYNDMQEDKQNNNVNQYGKNGQIYSKGTRSNNYRLSSGVISKKVYRDRRSNSCIMNGKDNTNKLKHKQKYLRVFKGNSNENIKLMDWGKCQKLGINYKPLISCNVTSEAKEGQALKKVGRFQSQFKNSLKIVKNKRQSKPILLQYQILLPNLQIEQFQQLTPYSGDMQQVTQAQNTCYQPQSQYKSSQTQSQFITQISDSAQLEQIRFLQQQKCIQRYLTKTGKKQLKTKQQKNKQEQQIRQTNDKNIYISQNVQYLENIKSEDKYNKNINNLFQNFVDNVNYVISDIVCGKEIEMIKKEKEKRNQINNAIKNYFIKNNRFNNAREIKKEIVLAKKFKQSMENIEKLNKFLEKKTRKLVKT